MKKFISFAFAAMMLVAVTSCGSKQVETTDTTAIDTLEQITDSTNEDSAVVDTVAVETLSEGCSQTCKCK